MEPSFNINLHWNLLDQLQTISIPKDLDIFQKTINWAYSWLYTIEPTEEQRQFITKVNEVWEKFQNEREIEKEGSRQFKDYNIHQWKICHSYEVLKAYTDLVKNLTNKEEHQLVVEGGISEMQDHLSPLAELLKKITQAHEDLRILVLELVKQALISEEMNIYFPQVMKMLENPQTDVKDYPEEIKNQINSLSLKSALVILNKIRGEQENYLKIDQHPLITTYQDLVAQYNNSFMNEADFFPDAATFVKERFASKVKDYMNIIKTAYLLCFPKKYARLMKQKRFIQFQDSERINFDIYGIPDDLNKKNEWHQKILINEKTKDRDNVSSKDYMRSDRLKPITASMESLEAIKDLSQEQIVDAFLKLLVTNPFCGVVDFNCENRRVFLGAFVDAFSKIVEKIEAREIVENIENVLKSIEAGENIENIEILKAFKEQFSLNFQQNNLFEEELDREEFRQAIGFRVYDGGQKSSKINPLRSEVKDFIAYYNEKKWKEGESRLLKYQIIEDLEKVNHWIDELFKNTEFAKLLLRYFKPLIA